MKLFKTNLDKQVRHSLKRGDWMQEYQFPFEPPMEDLKMVMESDGATCYIFNTACKDMTPEQKRKIDQRILSIYYHNSESVLLSKENQKDTFSLQKEK